MSNTPQDQYLYNIISKPLETNLKCMIYAKLELKFDAWEKGSVDDCPSAAQYWERISKNIFGNFCLWKENRKNLVKLTCYRLKHSIWFVFNPAIWRVILFQFIHQVNNNLEVNKSNLNMADVESAQVNNKNWIFKKDKLILTLWFDEF